MSIISSNVNRVRVVAALLGAVLAVALAPTSALASHRHSPRHHHSHVHHTQQIAKLGKGGAGCAADGGGYCVGQCVDFVWTKRPELSHLGNATDWLAGARARHIPTGLTPVVGAVAWWSGVDRTYADSIYGHVAYVIGVGNGTVTFEEMNALYGPGRVDTRTMALSSHYAPQGYIYGGPAGTGQPPAPPTTPAPVTAPQPPSSPAPVSQPTPVKPPTPVTPPAPTPTPTPTTPPPTPTYFAYHVTGTCRDGACGLTLRAGPGYSNYAAVGGLAEGAEADVVCQAMGQTVSNGYAASAIWDKLTNGDWVSDFYLDTPNIGTWSPPIPQC
jgi:surface antigen